MADQGGTFRNLPADLKYGMLCLLAGWVGVCFFAYQISGLSRQALSSNTMAMLIGLGGASCYGLLKTREWARRLTIMGNVVIMLSFLLYGLVLWKSQTALGAVAFITVALFGFATYYLLTRETSAFFRAANPKSGADPFKKP